MNETTRSTIAALCECADCRQYRVWRAEGTDEWQPQRDGWDTWSMGSDPSVEGDAAGAYQVTETATSF